MARPRPIMRFAVPLAAVVWAVSCAATVTAAEVQNVDPLEPMNRGIFWFNEKLDDYVMAPVAKASKVASTGHAGSRYLTMPIG